MFWRKRYFIISYSGIYLGQDIKGMITLQQKNYPNKAKIEKALKQKDVELLSFNMIQEVNKKDYKDFKSTNLN